MTANREPTADELNGVKQNTVHWPASALRVTQVDSDGNVIKSVRQRQNILGSAGTGSNPTKVFTLTTLSDVEIVEVFLDGVLLIETSQYTIDNDDKTVTMVGTTVYDAQIVSVFYNV